MNVKPKYPTRPNTNVVVGDLVRSYDFPGNAYFYILGRVVAIEHERYVIDQYARVTDSTRTEMSGKVYAPVNGLQGFAGVTMGVEVLSELLYAD